MTDLTDDWMNPQSSFGGWSLPVAENKTEYRILRKKRTICFGTPGYIDEWHPYAKFDDEAERDGELTWLQHAHPAWQLKASKGNPYFESLGIALG